MPQRLQHLRRANRLGQICSGERASGQRDASFLWLTRPRRISPSKTLWIQWFLQRSPPPPSSAHSLLLYHSALWVWGEKSQRSDRKESQKFSLSILVRPHWVTGESSPIGCRKSSLRSPLRRLTLGFSLGLLACMLGREGAQSQLSKQRRIECLCLVWDHRAPWWFSTLTQGSLPPSFFPLTSVCPGWGRKGLWKIGCWFGAWVSNRTRKGKSPSYYAYWVPPQCMAPPSGTCYGAVRVPGTLLEHRLNSVQNQGLSHNSFGLSCLTYNKSHFTGQCGKSDGI